VIKTDDLAGGITNGMDVVGWYMKNKWPQLADVVLSMADVEVRPQEYDQSKVTWTLSFAWKTMKAWFIGVGKEKSG
jgi:hypothetical protein